MKTCFVLGATLLHEKVMYDGCGVSCRTQGQHSAINTNQMQENELMFKSWELAMYHHERWVGCGCPEGRSGEDIPPAAKYMCCCRCL